ncbi:MAG: peptidylprolyl isomerase [Blautia sp.]
MKRKYLAVLCAAVLSACMFTGCGNKDTDNKETAKTASEEQQGTEKDAEEAGISDGSDTEGVQEGSQEEGQSGQPVEDAEDTAEETTQEPEKAADTGSSEDAVTLDVSKSLTGTHDVEIKVKDYGTIDVQLDADTAPITVTNFIKLVQENFYDGLTFHRIMDGFMIQGGDPLGNGTGGSDQTIKGEFKNNKVENNISHKRGVISMARSSDPDSASSQFFIVQTDSTFLDGDYAAFGEVTSGMDVVDAICKDAKPTDDNGTIPADQQPVIEYIKVLD